MTGKEIYKIWADNSIWSNWIRPVPFISINNDLKIDRIIDFDIPKLNFINNLPINAALFIDLPECNSITEGIALAKEGFRPIPIFNGTIEQRGTTPTCDNTTIVYALALGASHLQKIKISPYAPPAFLLNTNRLNRYKMNASIYDNSWDIYFQDLPSGKYFLENNITNIIVHSNKIHNDLKDILYKYQKSGIKIWFINNDDEIKLAKIKKPFKEEIL